MRTPCVDGFRNHRFKAYGTNAFSETCVRCGKLHADVARRRGQTPERIKYTRSVAHQWAVRMFGALGVAYQIGGQCYVGRFEKPPHVGPPPWPIEVWGAGATWTEAIKQALRDYSAVPNGAEGDES